MCRLFIGADPELWETRTRSLRIDGAATSIRLENFYWGVLEEIAFRDELSVNQLICRLYAEAIEADHTTGNFTSFLRVCCGRYLHLLSSNEIPRDNSPIRSLDADTILAREKRPGHLRLISDK